MTTNARTYEADGSLEMPGIKLPVTLALDVEIDATQRACLGART